MRYAVGKERLYAECPSPNIVYRIEIEGEMEGESFLRALRDVRDRHALLCCRLCRDADGSDWYEDMAEPHGPTANIMPDAPGLAEEVIEREQTAVYATERGEWMRHTLLTRAGGATWVLGAHHLAGDGTANLFFVRDVLARMQLPGVTLEKLPVRLFTMDMPPAGAKLPFKTRLLAGLVNRSWKKQARVFSRDEYAAMRAAYWKARGPVRREEIALTEVELSRLLAACRRNGVTLTSLFTAAALLETGRSDCGLAVNLRPAEMEGMGNWATGITVNAALDAQSGLWKTAASVQADMRKKLDNPASKFFLLRFMDAVSPTLIDAAYYAAYGECSSDIARKAAAMFGYGDSSKGFSFTNLTRVPIPVEYGGARIRNVSFIPPLVPNAQLLLGAATVGESLVLTLQSSAGLAMGEGLLGRVWRRVAEGAL